ncbi:hypothetical protein Glove_335g41 [Diversispora epigaea]|uniref:RNA helicase n=1 Tax=Diversispora epigaea TaxID=1348612 RepID=A0A397HIE4_9GLOM|nr:hypothetical protein Glove_335g41 [Diversispora epigaea]
MDLLKVLGAGAKFDKRRFKDVVSLFEPSNKPVSMKKIENDLDMETNLIQEIDFFHNSKRAIEESLGIKESIAKVVDDNVEQVEQSKFQNNHSNDSEDNEDNEEINNDPSELQIFNSQDDIKMFRKRHKIRVYGTDIPNPFGSFKDLETQYNFQSYLIRNLESSAYKQPTPIQMQAVPIMLYGRDLMAMAPTGSGKTLAYILPILHDLKGSEKMGYRALIISPTRELAKQIHREFKKMCVGKKFKICMLTKTSAATQSQAPHLRPKFDILISTPLRLVHAIQEENIDLKNVHHLILDEADKLLELGFLEQTDVIFSACTNIKLQKSLYSATLPSGVESLADNFMKDPIRKRGS